MGSLNYRILLMLCIISEVFAVGVFGFAVNWGTRSTHPFPPNIVVKLLKENGFNKVKLFEADPGALKALAKSGIEVMLGIPNEFLAPLADSVQFAENWVTRNVSAYVTSGVNIRYVAVGNEPFLKTYKDMYLQTTLPALQNIQAALIKAGLGKQVKITVPLNADVYQTDSGLPSGGNFRNDIHDLMISIVKFLSINGAPLTINIYPFLSLQSDPHFPKEYAFFGSKSNPIVDGSITYYNVMEANFDTLITALEKNGFASMPVIIGEMGWPTDGDPSANNELAQRFNQGLFDQIVQKQGTPKRPTLPEIYAFALIDEDAKSIDPGNFERHWGIFNFDGTIKYGLDLGNGKSLVPAKGVKYLARQWCVMSPEANILDPNLGPSISYACTYADCTSLGYGSSCGMLDARSNASYAFNIYYQTMNQRKDACQFNNLSMITTADPSPAAPGNSRNSSCRFEIMIDIGKHELARSPSSNLGLVNRKSRIVAMTSLLVLVSMLFG
ncbi:Glucan endo-1,3-beta-glucosidase 5 [Morus notabilis]|uniref:glucan endo-1,3-beta-D-glucosidase n=2 Tax=Morus notabilis TaxID=981085 RepID=W9RVZ1_9ROSA|nr:Glucan endo-1,3-beta-glucosidase 5 [Morus notabilis]